MIKELLFLIVITLIMLSFMFFGWWTILFIFLGLIFWTAPKL